MKLQVLWFNPNLVRYSKYDFLGYAAVLIPGCLITPIGGPGVRVGLLRNLRDGDCVINVTVRRWKEDARLDFLLPSERVHRSNPTKWRDLFSISEDARADILIGISAKIHLEEAFARHGAAVVDDEVAMGEEVERGNWFDR